MHHKSCNKSRNVTLLRFNVTIFFDLLGPHGQTSELPKVKVNLRRKRVTKIVRIVIT